MKRIVRLVLAKFHIQPDRLWDDTTWCSALPTGPNGQSYCSSTCSLVYCRSFRGRA